MEMELDFSCDLLPCHLCHGFPQWPLICCQVFNLVFFPAFFLEIHNAMSLWYESRDKKLETHATD
jgi:hypothetical protein